MRFVLLMAVHIHPSHITPLWHQHHLINIEKSRQKVKGLFIHFLPIWKTNGLESSFFALLCLCPISPQHLAVRERERDIPDAGRHGPLLTFLSGVVFFYTWKCVLPVGSSRSIHVRVYYVIYHAWNVLCNTIFKIVCNNL